jgi:UDP-3-O-[3-hydroxymyristoyl] glucosamine N-acyltransferase
MKVRDIAMFLEGEVVGNGDLEVTGVAKIEEAKNGDLCFISNPKYEKFLETTSATAVMVATSVDLTKHPTLPPAVITVADPYSSFIVALERFSPQPELLSAGIHPTAVIDHSTSLGDGASIGAYVVIGRNCKIGARVRIHPHAVIGDRVTIGDDSLIFPQVTIREECVLGKRVVVQPGAVIGGDGFGFAPKKDGTYQKIPQRGIVVIEDDVEIQANTCVDRATMGETRIKRGTKLDNLVQIAHNVQIGEDVVIAGCSAVAGSTKVGNHVMVGGNVSITGHIEVADRVIIAGHSGVSRALNEEGKMYLGYPAREANRSRRMEGALRQLPETLVEFRQLIKKVQELEDELRALKGDSKQEE